MKCTNAVRLHWVLASNYECLYGIATIDFNCSSLHSHSQPRSIIIFIITLLEHAELLH